MKIGLKLTLTFFSIAFLSMLVVGVISYYRAKTSLKEESFSRLTAVREMKAGQISNYFSKTKDEIITFSEDPTIIQAMKNFKEGFTDLEKELRLDSNTLRRFQSDLDHYLDTVTLVHLNKNLEVKLNATDIFTTNDNGLILQHEFLVNNPNPVEEKLRADSMLLNCKYNSVHKKFHPVLRNICERFGYYDIFLIDNVTGNVVYTVYKETDFASSLVDGPFDATNFAECYRKARDKKHPGEIAVVDFAPYLPSYNEHASFIACPIYDGDEKIGVLAFQMPIDKIDGIMTNDRKWSDVGLGRTGETYLVGEDFTLRNQSRFLIEDRDNYFKMLGEVGVKEKEIARIKEIGSAVGLQEVRTTGTEEALNGQTGSKIFKDYRGVLVLSAYKPINILGLNWVIMSEIDEEEAFDHIVHLRNNIIQAFIVLLVLLIFLSVFVSRKITKPLKELTYDAQELSKGNFDVEIKITGTDEIGILADGFKNMQTSISQLIHGLEDKVKERTSEVTQQKHIIEEKQKEIVDSINYAKRIQYTLLANEAFLEKYLKNYFVFFQPKDIVSGDFYWATKTSSKFYLAVCDSTGHGVPGAFMSLLNISFLNEAINEKKISEPHLILNYVRERLIKNISKDGGRDGMDGVLLCMDIKSREITYAGAHNAPVIVRKNKLIEFDADKMPIGKGIREDEFQLFELNAKKGDMVYIYTDGYADQFGGPKGKKFKYKNLHEKFLNLSQESMEKQREELQNIFEDWRGELEQIDDVCVFGLRV